MSKGYGEAAVAEAKWGAIVSWFMGAPADGALSHALPVAWEAVSQMQEYQRTHLGWPRCDGRSWPTPALDGLNLASRREAEQVAVDTLADWERAGCPCLSPIRIKQTYQFLLSTPAFRARYRGQA